VDKAQLLLMYNVVMLSSDGLKLRDEGKVAKLREQHLTMLQRYPKIDSIHENEVIGLCFNTGICVTNTKKMQVSTSQKESKLLNLPERRMKSGHIDYQFNDRFVGQTPIYNFFHT